MMLPSDRKLLDAFRRGEEQAIERVYRAYVDQVTGLLRRGFTFTSGGNAVRFQGFSDPWELETAVQDTFIKAFSPEARRTYDGVKPFGPYLLTIAKNGVISRLRADFRERRRRSALAAEGIVARPPSPEAEAMRTELEELVEEFRRSLPEELRRFLTVRYGEETNLMAAARKLGVTRMKARLLDQKVKDRFVAFLREQGVLSDGDRPGHLADLLMLLLTLLRPGA